MLSEINECETKWKKLKANFIEIVNLAVPSYQKMSPLIRYLESETLTAPLIPQNGFSRQWKSLTTDFQTLMNSY
jgi:hypothetical protein